MDICLRNTHPGSHSASRSTFGISFGGNLVFRYSLISFLCRDAVHLLGRPVVGVKTPFVAGSGNSSAGGIIGAIVSIT
jgi:hypothetical protein